MLDNAAPRRASWDSPRWTVRVPLSDQRIDGPARMDAVLVAAGNAAGGRVGFDIAGTWPAVGTTPQPAAAAAAEPAAAPTPQLGLAAALLFALIGGAILNLMPCVFPVLSLKVLGFAGHADDRRALALGGVAYTVGVVLSFVALAALLLALRAGGEQLRLDEPVVE